MFRSAVYLPLPTVTNMATLGCHANVAAPSPFSQRARDEALSVTHFAGIPAIGVGRIEPRNTAVERFVDDPDRIGFRRALVERERDDAEPDGAQLDSRFPECTRL